MSDDTTNGEELRFWEQNRFDVFINKCIAVEVPNIHGIKKLLKHIKETRDYYAVVERVKELKRDCK